MFGREIVKLVINELAQEHPLFRLHAMGKREFIGYLHQAELLYKLLLRNPIRALIADEIGLGKTVEAILVIDWGLRKGSFRRILILTPKSLVSQWDAELTRAGLTPMKDLDLLENDGIFLFKIDTVKKDPHKSRILKSTWDLIVVDEAHKLSLETERIKFVKELIQKNSKSSLLLLTATPHKGDPEDYIEKIFLIDPGLDRRKLKNLSGKISRDFYLNLIDSIVFRRSKRDVNEVYEKQAIFTKAVFRACVIQPTEKERNYVEKLDELTRDLLSRFGQVKGLELVAAIIDKRGLSSPEAGLKTFERILENLSKSLKVSEDLEEDLKTYFYEEDIDSDPDKLVDALSKFMNYLGQYKEKIEELRSLAQEITRGRDTKLSTLLGLVRKHLSRGDKVVVFSEYADTANYVFKKIRETFAKDYSEVDVRVITGDILANKQDTIEDVKKWLSEPGPKVLVSTDVASEGLNLQQASVVIHYELPWSLVKLEQRAGRVWRLGQDRDVHVYSLLMAVGFEYVVFNIVYSKLLNLIGAYVPPSLTPEETLLRCGSEETLMELQPKDDMSLVPAVSETSEKLTSFALWRTYKTAGPAGVSELAREYVNAFNELKEKMRQTFHVGNEFIRSQSIRETLEYVVGFTSRDEFKTFLETVADGLGISDELVRGNFQRLASKIYAEASKSKSLGLPLVARCRDYDGKLQLYKTCVKVGGSERLCWLLSLRDGEVIKLPELAKELKHVATLECEVESTNETLGDDSSVDSVKRHVWEKLVKNSITKFLSYLNYTEREGLRSREHEIRFVPRSLESGDISIDVRLLASVEKLEKPRLDSLIDAAVGNYEDSKLELEEVGIRLLRDSLSKTHVITDVRNNLHLLDLIVREIKTGITELVELKTLKESSFVIFTNSEKELGEKLESDGQEYCLYVVDLKSKEIRVYRHPLTSDKLELIKTVDKDGKRYHVFREKKSPDKVFKLSYISDKNT